VFVGESCHNVDLELLPIAIRTPAPLSCYIAASVFIKSIYICFPMSKYMLAKIIFKLPIIISETTVSAPEGRSGNRIPVGARFFAHVQTGRGAHPAPCTMGTGSFPGVKRLGRGADHPPLLAPRSRKSRAISLPTL
jgi:hypothetical protein